MNQNWPPNDKHETISKQEIKMITVPVFHILKKLEDEWT